MLSEMQNRSREWFSVCHDWHYAEAAAELFLFAQFFRVSLGIGLQFFQGCAEFGDFGTHFLGFIAHLFLQGNVRELVSFLFELIRFSGDGFLIFGDHVLDLINVHFDGFLLNLGRGFVFIDTVAAAGKKHGSAQNAGQKQHFFLFDAPVEF